MYSPRFMAKGGFLIDRPIMLVGLMGAGKTTVGRRLAARLSIPFVDSDDEVERQAGVSITEIFEGHGESWFREIEREMMARLIGGPPKVIAAGGGAFLDERTRAAASDRCVTIWIDAEVETLVERLSGRDDRPLLRNQDPAPALAVLAEQRGPIYAQAQLRVRSAGIDAEKTVDRIIDMLEHAA